MAELALHAMANVTRTGRVDATLLRDQGHRLVFMPDHLPDKVDRAIVARLQRDGRIANVDLADAIVLSPSACLRRGKALGANGDTGGYPAEGSPQPGAPRPAGFTRPAARGASP